MFLMHLNIDFKQKKQAYNRWKPHLSKNAKVIFTQIDPQRYVWHVAQNGQSDLTWVSSEPVTYTHILTRTILKQNKTKRPET